MLTLLLIRDIAKGGVNDTAVPPWEPQLPSVCLLFEPFNPTILPSNALCVPTEDRPFGLLHPFKFSFAALAFLPLFYLLSVALFHAS